MKFQFRSQTIKASALLLRAALGMLLLCVSAHASTIFHVNVDTSSLIGNSNGPFLLDFQFNNGSVLGNNSATVDNFNYFGGSVVNDTVLIGGALGNIGSSVLFNNNAPFQELFQTFAPGTRLKFDVTLTTNVDGATPDVFAFAILDHDLFNIPTNGLGDSLLLVNLNNANPPAQTSAGTGEFSSVRTSVPEPASCILLLVGVPFLALMARRKRDVM